MGDSDDEYDRKRRDKFRGERAGTGGTEGNSYRGSDRREERSRGREEWQERPRPSKENALLDPSPFPKFFRRESWSSGRARGGRAEYRDYRGGPRGYSPGRSEGPAKRMRPDWGIDDRRYGLHDYGSYGWAHDSYGPHPAHQAYALHAQQPPIRETGIGGAVSGETQPAMMSFKSFLAAQDDSITDEDAIKKYNDYKLEFRRQQLNEFFVAHKDEEWFKIKYHPEESLKRKEEQHNSLKNRLNVFLDLLNNSHLDKITVDVDQSEQLIRLLDTVVIKLEGGTDDDLKVLDEQPKPAAPVELAKPVEIILDADGDGDEGEIIKKEVIESEEEDKPKEDPDKKTEDSKEPSAPLCMDIDPHHRELQEQAKIFSRCNSTTDTPSAPVSTDNGKEVRPPGSNRKRKRSRNSGATSGSSSGSSSSSSSSSESSDSEEEGGEKRETGATTEEPKPPGHTDDIDDSEKEVVEKPTAAVDTEDADSVMEDGQKEEEKSEEKDVDKVEEKMDDDQNDENNKDGEPEKKEPIAMHKTTSIFLRNLSPTITKAEVEAMCKRYGGFLRVALADPLPERRWFRRGWVTFRREVNIKEICWNLNNIRLRDCELGAIVNRDLSRRIRPISGITLHRQIVRADARLAARLCHHLDNRVGLWGTKDKEANNKDDNSAQFGLVSANPVLHNITEYLIEEGSAEEDELLGLSGETENTDAAATTEGATEGAPPTDTVERDPQLTAVLDRLILYLRIVHSVDYYNHCEYPYEDEMPNRCGIMHARGPAPSNKVATNELNEYIRVFEGKMSAFLQDTQTLDDDELVKLGTKDSQGEVEKFIQANTQELAKDKWLCPLSGKKFKGPDFIRKHIFNKHGEKVDEVKKEVEYFNNYLRDVKRPQLSEHPTAGRRPEPAHQPSYGSSYGSSGYGSYGRGGYGGYAHPPYGYAPPAYAPAPYAPPRHARSFARGRETYVDRSRPVIAYNDLDLPENVSGRGGVSDFRPVIHYRDLDAPREPEEFV